MTRPSRSLPFRLLVILAGAFALLAAFAPRANADLLRYYDMEGANTDPYEANLQSHSPALEVGPGTTLFMDDGSVGLPNPAIRFSEFRNIPAPGLSANVIPPSANLKSFGVIRSGQGPLGVRIPLPNANANYNIMSVSFGYANNGNGYDMVQLQMSTNGGATFQNISGVIALPQTGSNGVAVNIPVTVNTIGFSNLVLRLLFSGGQSNGIDLQFQLDNIQVNGLVPEPATVAGGLLGVLGLCWHQRRRLISAVRFRRT